MLVDQKPGTKQPSPFPYVPPRAIPVAEPVAAPSRPVTAGPGSQVGPGAAKDLFGHLCDGQPAVGACAPLLGPVAPAPLTAGAAPTTAGAIPTMAGATPTTAGAAQAPTGPAGAPIPHHVPTIAEYHATVDAQLDAEIKANRTTRTDLDKAKKDKAPTAEATSQKLDGDRNHLLDELKERSGVYDASIHDVNAKLGPGKLPAHLSPEQQALVTERTKLEAEKAKYSDQQTALQRWHDRGQINEINDKLKDPTLDPKVRTQLLADKKTLATGLLSTTKSYQQFDERWGDTVYGKDRSYTTMTEAGCGPTALSMMLDFRDQEDPEGQHSRGVKDPYTPRKAADYATNHGRVKGSGTDGDTMINDLDQGFPGYSGQNIGHRADAAESLHNGIPVMFVGHDITGKGADGKNVSPYHGHFMLLNGVSDDDKTFDVHDGGRNNSRNIHTISDKQLGAGADGYWNISHSGLGNGR